MKRISRYGLMFVVVAALAATPAAWATCNLDTQIVGHTLGGWITNCPDDNPIEGYIWLLATPAVTNSNGQNFVCRHDGELLPDSGADCTFAPGSGVDGDDVVTVYMEWGTQNAGVLGCPNQAQSGNGTTPLGIQVVCNNGATAMFQSGFSTDFQQFVLEWASTNADGTVAADFNNSATITSVSAGPSPSASNVCVNVPLPTFHSDCDPGAGSTGISCPGGPTSRPTPQRGTLVSAIGPCNGSPDLRLATWVPTTVQPDAAGNACNVFNFLIGQCAYIGIQNVFGGVPAGGVGGYVQVGGPAASNDKVKIDSALTAQGRLKVAFSTTNETSIVGFNVYSDGAKLNSSLIGSKGVGNNAYSFEIGRGALKGGKTVLVESVMKDGTVAKTAPVTLK